ncbi:YadA-like family protein [Cardiobacterium hominis]|uniref:YadA-like family protein n=1 Tax=Cardiobacterium hominis TaxID=2718 RepID=UPI0024910451|nr:YadA-like family protein [Cardiobacterium hominis]
MNHTYKTLYNTALGAWVAVPEIARNRGKAPRSYRYASGAHAFTFARTALASALLLVGGQAWAAIPEGTAAKATDIAIGTGASADSKISGGYGSTAVGTNAKATSRDDVAIGYGAGAKSGSGASSGRNGERVMIGANANVGSDREVKDIYVGGTINKISLQAKEVGQAVAIGGGTGVQKEHHTYAYGDQSLAIGSDTLAYGDSSVAIGGDDLDQAGNQQTSYTDPNSGAQTTGTVRQAYNALTGDTMNSGVYAKTVSKQAAVAVGVQAQAADLGVALGAKSGATKTNSVAIGTGAQATLDNAVAIGGGSKTLKAGTKQESTTINGVTYNWAGGGSTLPGDIVSFGATDYERQLKHVAAGEVSATSTDAINGSQLYAVASTLQAGQTHYYSVNSTLQGTGSNYNNDGATGANALAAGAAASAAGTSATAVGHEANASGTHSIAIGNKAKTNESQFGIAIGYEAELGGTGKNTSIAIGKESKATALDSIAIGRGNKALDDGTIALGTQVNLQGIAAIGIGQNVSTQQRDGIAIGNSAKTGLGENNTAIGSYADANVGWSTAVGTRAYTNGNGAVALGTMAHGGGQRSTAIGSFSYSKALTSTALGYHTIATDSANYSTALGTGTVVSGASSGGWSAAPHGNPHQFDNSKRSYIGGTGNYAIGNTNIIGNQTSNSVALGNNIQLGATSATLTSVDPSGKGNSIATRKETVNFGGVTALTNAVAVGNSAKVAANNGVSLGANAETKYADDVALGANAVTAAKVATNDATVSDLTYSGFAGNNPIATVSVGTKDKERTITNVAAGRISKESTDAINGSQLYWTQNALGNVGNSAVTVLGGNAEIKKDGEKAGTISMTNIGGTGKDTVHDAIKASRTEVTGGTNIAKVEKTQDGTDGHDIYTINADGASVSAGSAAVKVTQGTKDAATNITDYAVDLSDDTKNSLKKADSALQNVVSNNPNLTATKNGDTVTLDFSATPSFTSVTTGNTTMNNSGLTINNGPSVTNQGIDAGKKTITNVAPGVNSTDAVNKDQLDAVQAQASKHSSVVAGDNVTVETGVNGTGGVEYKVHAEKSTVSGVANETVVKQMQGANHTTNYQVGLDQKVKDDIKKGVDAHDTVTNKGLTFTGDSGTTGVKKLGDQVSITGDGNIQTKADANGVQVTLNRNLNVDSVKTGDTTINNDGLKINGGPSVTKTGIDAGSQKITNVKAGEADTDAVNVSQLKKAADAAKTKVVEGDGIKVAETQNPDGSSTYKVSADTAAITTTGNKAATTGNSKQLATAQDVVNAVNNSGFTLKTSANGGEKDAASTADEVINPDDTVEMVAGKNMKVKQEANGKITYSTKDDVEFDKVTVGGVVIDKNDGINAGNKKITNVANGTDDKDAVNVSQLKGAADALGGGAGINPDGTFKAPSYNLTDGNPAGGGNKTYNNVGDALNGLNAAVNKPLTFKGDIGTDSNRPLGSTVSVTGGINDINKLTENNIGVVSDGNGDLNVRLAKDINVQSVTTTDAAGNKTVTNGNGVTITPAAGGNPVSLTDKGLNNGGNTITNVAPGVNDTDAANVQQVKAARTEVKAGTNIVSVDKTQANDGHDIYTVNAEKSTVSGVGDVIVTTTTLPGNVTNYEVSLSGGVKQDIGKGVQALNIVQTQGLTFHGDSGSTGVKKLGDSVAIMGDGNIRTAADAGGVQVKLNPDVNVNSVTTGDTKLSDAGVAINNGPSMTKQGIDAGNLPIRNVAPGRIARDSRDAVNGAQLYALGRHVDNVDKRAKAGTASAIATAGLPQAYRPGASMVAAAGGYYDGQSAVAIGVSTISDNGKWIIKGAANVNSKEAGAVVGIGYQW